jgi:hypothetical protein
MGIFKLPEREHNLAHPLAHLIEEAKDRLERNQNCPIGKSLYRMVRQKMTEVWSDTISLPCRDGKRRLFIPYHWEQYFLLSEEGDTDVSQSVNLYLLPATLDGFSSNSVSAGHVLYLEFKDGVPIMGIETQDANPYHFIEGITLETAHDAKVVTRLLKMMDFDDEDAWGNCNADWHPKMTEWVEALRWEWLTDDV